MFVGAGSDVSWEKARTMAPGGHADGCVTVCWGRGHPLTFYFCSSFAICTSVFNVRRRENVVLANPLVRLLSPSTAEDILNDLDIFCACCVSQHAGLSHGFLMNASTVISKHSDPLSRYFSENLTSFIHNVYFIFLHFVASVCASVLRTPSRPYTPPAYSFAPLPQLSISGYVCFNILKGRCHFWHFTIERYNQTC